MAILKLFLHLPVGNGGFSRKSVPIYGPWCSDGMDFLSFLVERFTGWNGYRIVTPENRNEVISPDFTHLPSGPVTHLYSKLIQKMNTPKNITKHNHKSSQNIKQHPKKKPDPKTTRSNPRGLPFRRPLACRDGRGIGHRVKRGPSPAPWCSDHLKRIHHS